MPDVYKRQPEELPELLDCWSYKGTETLEARKKLLEIGRAHV